jgi:hypothetical protein
MHSLFFAHYVINDMIFGNRLLKLKNVLPFTVQLSSKAFIILRIIQTDVTTYVHGASCEVLVRLEFSR